MNMAKSSSSKLTINIILLALLEVVVKIHGAPMSMDIYIKTPSMQCPPPDGRCGWEPEDTCDDDSECISYSDDWINLCCPHACKGYKTCREFYVPAPRTTNRPTTEEVTTTKDTMKPSTQSTTTTRISMSTTRLPTNPVTSTTKHVITVIPSSTTDAKLTSTEDVSSTKTPSTSESPTTPRTTTDEVESTTKVSTRDLETTVTPSTTQAQTTTEMPTTTKQSTTTIAVSTEPTTITLSTTEQPKPDLSVCGQSATKDILFVIDGTVNYRQFWPTTARQFKQIKHFLKDVISELKGDKFRIGVMQYGGLKEPEMVLDFPEGMPIEEMMYRIDDVRQMGGEKRKTGATMAVASNKFYEINSVYDRANAQDIVVLITRGRPSDKKQTNAEIEMLKRKRVRVITIGLSTYPKYLRNALRYIPTSPADLFLSKYGELASKKTEVLKKLCLPAQLPGTRSLCRNKQYDINFVVDGSRSIKNFKFDQKRKFLRDVLFLLESESDLNIGMMQFSTVEKTEEVLELEKHSLDEELHVIENMYYHSGRRTMLGDALNRVKNEVFTGRDGDRASVENVLVIFSDGEAHDIYTAYKEADILKKRNVRMIAISAEEHGYIGPELKKLASDPKYAMSVELTNTAYFAKKAVSMICQTEE